MSGHYKANFASSLRKYKNKVEEKPTVNKEEESIEEKGEEKIYDEFVVVDDTSFSLEINGFILENIIEYLRATNREGCFKFNNNGIRYERSDEDVLVINRLELWANSLNNYVYDSTNESLNAGINLADAKNAVKGINKANKVSLSKEKGKNLINITACYDTTTNKQKTSRESSRTVFIQKTQDFIYDIDEFLPEKPTFSVQSDAFLNSFKVFQHVKCELVTLRVYPTYLEIEVKEGDVVLQNEKLGMRSGVLSRFKYKRDTDASPDSSTSDTSLSPPLSPSSSPSTSPPSSPKSEREDNSPPRSPSSISVLPSTNYKEYVVKKETTKSVCLLSKLNKNGTIKFYRGKNYLKIATNIATDSGIIGKIEVILRNHNTKSDISYNG